MLHTIIDLNEVFLQPAVKSPEAGGNKIENTVKNANVFSTNPYDYINTTCLGRREWKF